MEYFKQPIGSSGPRRLRANKKILISSCVIAVIAVTAAGTVAALAFPTAKSTTSSTPLPRISNSFLPFPTRDAAPPENAKEQPDGGAIVAPGDEDSEGTSPFPEDDSDLPSVGSLPSSSVPPKPSNPPGRSANKTVFVPPVSGYVITARYSQQGNWTNGYHTGIDLAVPVGTLVRSTSSGMVAMTGSNPSYGNYAVVRHGGNEFVLYAHLSNFAVKSGESVTAGQELGLSGATGNVTGPHLHFEVRTKPNFGSDIDPVAYLSKRGVNL
ncbi:M23 family metallopeptidase [Streptomyces phaeochromogenes]|uniref:M23 family metallopeptidase n=1 Tax=Streptomyces phaeochromogenes TaxID=1923 RepID=UPI00340C6B59